MTNKSHKFIFKNNNLNSKNSLNKSHDTNNKQKDSTFSEASRNLSERMSFNNKNSLSKSIKPFQIAPPILAPSTDSLNLVKSKANAFLKSLDNFEVISEPNNANVNKSIPNLPKSSNMKYKNIYHVLSEDVQTKSSIKLTPSILSLS